MENEKFDNATLDIVSKALKKASNGGLLFKKQYTFGMARIEYLLKGDDSPIGDHAQRCLFAYGLEPLQQLFDFYVKACANKKVLPTHSKFIIFQLFSAFTSHLIQKNYTDIAFQYRCYGSIKDDDVPEKRFGSALVNVRMIRNKKEKYFFKEKDGYMPEDIPDGMKELLKKNEIVFLIQGMEKDFNVYFPLSELTDFCIDYM